MDIFKKFGKKADKSKPSKQAKETEPSQLFSTSGDYGLKAFSEPENPSLDIVFVHGLTGNRETTWKDQRTGVMWPKDLLPHDIPTARILTFGYDADVVRLMDTASSNTVRDHGKALANELGRKRYLDGCKDRPLIFVAHNLGGLVCEQALLVSRGAAEPWMNAMLEATTAIAFLGTPHHGSNVANWTVVLTRLSSVLRATNKAIVDLLRPASEMLANLQQEFHTMLNARQSRNECIPEIFCFFEELPYNNVVPHIVPKSSAILPQYNNQGIHANHAQMTRFCNQNDPGYQNIAAQLRIWNLHFDKIGHSQHPTVRCLPAPPQEKPALSSPGHIYSGPVIVGRGKIIQGNITSTGDVNFTYQ